VALQIEKKVNTLFIDGDLSRHSVPDLYRYFKKSDYSGINKIDIGNVKDIDSAGVVFLDEILEKLKDSSPEIVNADKKVEGAIKIFSSQELKPGKVPEHKNIFLKIGENFFYWKDSFADSIYMTADIAFWSFLGIFSRKSQRKGSISQQCLNIGVDAVGIISLLSFILGLILALQSAAQLRQFGANIYVADLLAVSMVREMGPMMTAIIVAGRSGSAIASEIATMKVTEEIDALRIMAINPIRYVVVPKFIAISICMPLLVTISIIMGILGGLVIGVTYLDLSAVAFFNELFSVLTLKDELIGLSKSLFFAWVIVIIGSYFGFKVEGGAEGVGKVTTKAVVASIFAVIILDAIFSLLYML